MNREHLIELIAKYLVVSGYIRLDNYKTYSMKNEFRFSKQNKCKLKDPKSFKVLWTTY